MTITWHVEKLRTPHIDAYEIKKLMDWMKGIYGSHMKEYRGEKKNYLGMDLEVSVVGEVRVTIKYDIKSIVYDFPETIDGILATPEADNLYAVREDFNRKCLDKYPDTAFHH